MASDWGRTKTILSFVVSVPCMTTTFADQCQYPFHGGYWHQHSMSIALAFTCFLTLTRGSHLYVSCWSVCDRDQNVWSGKSALDRLIVPFWGSWSLDFSGSKVKLQPRVLDPLILATWRPPWSLDRPRKGLWSLDSILILVANASTRDI